LRQILFQIGKTIYGDFSDVVTGLWRGLFELYEMSRVVPTFQIWQNFYRRQPLMWTAFHYNELSIKQRSLWTGRILLLTRDCHRLPTNLVT